MVQNPNIFIDCGFFIGNAIKIYLDKGIIDDTWDIYAFEPNVDLDVEAAMELIPLNIKMSREAVWVNNGVTDLQIGTVRKDSASIIGTAGQSEHKLIEVKTFDFSEFISKLPDVMIICSMDIEGSEYRVLHKMLEDKIINKLTILDIEFHDRLMTDVSLKDSKDLMYELCKWTAVKMKGWL